MPTRAAIALAMALAVPAAAQPVSDGALPPPVETAPLGAPDPGAAGLLPPDQTGLPRALWQGSDGATLAELIGAADPSVPALRAMFTALMLAETTPPATGGRALFQARLDALTAQGAVEEAYAMITLVGRDDPQLFAVWAELSLLLGRAGPMCRELAARPLRSDDLSLRIYCLARSGDWPRAALTYDTALALGQLPARRAGLLALYLDPETEIATDLTPPVRPTPLEVRLYEAIGEALPTAPLPLPFAVQDLSGDNGWRAQLLAAERLARAGAVPPNRLLGLYSLRKPAASGGIWDRVSALQDFEAALATNRPDQIAPALLRVWPQMASAGLLVPFATLFGEPLSDIPLTGRAGTLALYAAALSPVYETALPDTGDAAARFLQAIARGAAPAVVPPLPHAGAVAAGFGDAAVPPDDLQRLLATGRLGEAILRAIKLFAIGADGNPEALTHALATLRAAGLEDTARRAALQVVILDAERARR